MREIEKKLMEFDKWAEEETATFDSDGEDEVNVSFKELVFYDKLRDKIRDLLT